MEPKPNAERYVPTHREPWLKWSKMAYGNAWLATSHGGTVAGGLILQVSKARIDINGNGFSLKEHGLHDIVDAMLFAEDRAMSMLEAEYGELLKHYAQRP